MDKIPNKLSAEEKIALSVKESIINDISEIENHHLAEDYINAERKLAYNAGMFNTLIRPFIFEEENATKCCRVNCKEVPIYVCYGIAFNAKINFCEKHGKITLMRQVDRINNRNKMEQKENNVEEGNNFPQ